MEILVEIVEKKQINFLPYRRFIGFQKRWASSTEIDFLVLHYGNENTVGLLVNEVDLPVPMFILRLLLFLSEIEGIYILETNVVFLRGQLLQLLDNIKENKQITQKTVMQ